MFRYKTQLNLECRTFKFIQGLNTIIPKNQTIYENLLIEMDRYFSMRANTGPSKFRYIRYTSSDPNYLNTIDIDASQLTIVLLDMLDSPIRDLSTLDKLKFKHSLINFTEMHQNVYIINVTDDFDLIESTHSILIDNPRVVRKFKTYSAFINCLKRCE